TPDILERLAGILSNGEEDCEQVVQVLCEALGQTQIIQLQPRQKRAIEPAAPRVPPVCSAPIRRPSTPATLRVAGMLACLAIPVLLIGMLIGIGCDRCMLFAETLVGADFRGDQPFFTQRLFPLPPLAPEQ